MRPLRFDPTGKCPSPIGAESQRCRRAIAGIPSWPAFQHQCHNDGSAIAYCYSLRFASVSCLNFLGSCCRSGARMPQCPRARPRTPGREIGAVPGLAKRINGGRPFMRSASYNYQSAFFSLASSSTSSLKSMLCCCQSFVASHSASRRRKSSRFFSWRKLSTMVSSFLD
jgi:hypothetical protein